MTELTFEMIMVMSIIGVVIFLFVVEWFRVDVVAIMMMVVLPLLQLVTPKEAFIGLSSNAVVSIIAVIIIGAGLDRTGVINKLVAPIMRIAGASANRIIIAISLTVATISSFMQNIGAAALFLPAIQRISKTQKIPISKILMPVGFSAILGGTITLVGSSPLILLNDLLLPYELEPFNLFDVTPIGLALAVAGIACFVIFGRFILPQSKEEDSAEEEKQNVEHILSKVGQIWELKVAKNDAVQKGLLTVEDLRKRYLANTLAIAESTKEKTISPAGDIVVHPGVDLVAIAHEKDIRRMARQEGMEVKKTIEVFKKDVGEQSAATVEAVVAPRSPLINKTLHEVAFEHHYQVTPLAVFRHEDTYRSEISEIPLRVGDTILLHGTWGRLQALQKEGSLLFATPLDVELMRPQKAAIALFWLVTALVMVIVFKIQLSVCLMTGALGMIVTRVLSIDEAYRAVDWRTIFLLGGLIPLGIATEKTGTAAWIAQSVFALIGDVSPIVLLTVIGVLATFFTLVISNVGATVLLVPLVVNMANAAGADPRMAALVVGLATSNSFILPTHQVNALYMGPGRYRSVDFMKAGALVSVVFLVVMIGMISLIYGI